MRLLDHVSITVTDLARARPFYEAVMASLGASRGYGRQMLLGSVNRGGMPSRLAGRAWGFGAGFIAGLMGGAIGTARTACHYIRHDSGLESAGNEGQTNCLGKTKLSEA